MIARAVPSARRRWGLVVCALLLASFSACDKMPLTAPTESTIQLFATGVSVPLSGWVDIVATVTEQAGTPVQNGTVVTFTTTLGRIDPTEARTHNGKVTVRLAADGRSGTARVTAFSGGAEQAELEIPIGAAVVSAIVLTANPSSVGAPGGTVQLTAAVRDESGDPVSGILVTFSTTAGSLSASNVTTDQNGEARATLTTTREAEVTARAGGEEAQVTVGVRAAPTVSVTVSPANPVAGSPANFSITVTPAEDGNPVQSITIDFGDGDSRSLGRSSTTASHIYDEPGTYTVRVRVRDTEGQEVTQVLIVSVVEGV
jgi:Bacterial Ig-like domain (group 1)/PKD domain